MGEKEGLMPSPTIAGLLGLFVIVLVFAVVAIREHFALLRKRIVEIEKVLLLSGAIRCEECG
ncbi:MAG TPA: hypothetical protein VMW52_05595, partial [Phycisphaerae bacterium]|nr:hypothetical protein [Phycisphaerae bacterium]